MTSSLARVRSFFRALFGRRRAEREMDEEWQFHREQRVDALVAGGLRRREAEAQARREFGDLLCWKEQAREARGLGPLQGLGADVRYAVRQVRRAPGVAVVIVCTLALAIVNETAARLFWGDDEPIGRHIGFDSGVDLQIVGVARNSRTRSLASSSHPAVDVARSRHPSVQVAVRGTTATAGRGRSGTSHLILRTTGEAAAIADALHGAAAEAGVTIGSVTTLEDAIDALVMPQRLGRALLTGLSFTAAVATLIGIAGLVPGAVARRTKEIGVRMALGASSGEVLRETVRSTLLLVLAGLAGGSVAAWWSGRLAERFLYGVGPTDPATLAAAVLLLGATAVVAAVIPALRALRIDPVTVLRAE